jgi:PIN domain nuclease of toxin-antitoxin system
MKLLLDTATFLWLTIDSPQLSVQARDLFSDPANDVHLSVVSAWEIAVKHALGKLALPEKPESFIPRQRGAHSISSLPLTEPAVLKLPTLPLLHRDPFDRILVAQALAHDMTLLTPDATIRAYPVKSAW